MRLFLSFPVPTGLVAPMLSEAITNLTAEKRLKHSWLLEMVTPSLDNNKEFGAVVYPCRRDPKNGDMVAFKERRIVLKSLPNGTKIRTRFVEIGFGSGPSFSPLLGTEDCPSKSLFSKDRKYFADFSAIVEALGKLLTAANTASVSAPKEREEKITVE
ncbi:MAG: hypothetical protein WAV98_02555 [Minisyncoccia bacterium]